MTFVSYSQNAEDVMLFRALRHIDAGFYIDVGAWSPDLDSVTRAFYERGWNGINIEPNPAFQKEYADKRPRDINLCLALSDTEGVAPIYLASNSGLSSLDEGIAKEHEASGFDMSTAATEVTTLARLHKELFGGKDVHFLKIDTEGFERRVLLGNDWTQCRPWVVVVESTVPNAQRENHTEWEPILVNADYTFAYADGLNRFYVANERVQLLEAFSYPPNVFDEFVMNAQVQAENRAHVAEQWAAEAEQWARRAEKRALELDGELRKILHSRSWRWTKPLRDFAAKLRRDRHT